MTQVLQLLVIEPARRQWNVTRQQQSHVMVQRWASSHNLPQSNRTLGPQVPALTTVTLEEFHLDNLECKTTPSQFFSRLKWLTSDEFLNSVPVSQTCLSASSRLTRGYRTDIESY